MCKVELRCKVADTDFDLGGNAGIYPNAIWRLVWVLDDEVLRTERVRIPGFYDQVRPYSPAEQEVVDALPAVDEQLKRVRGLKRR